MPDLLEEERADEHAANSIDWKKLFPIDMSIDGSVRSFVQLLITISAAAKDDTILMAFFASHGTIIPAGTRIYAASSADAAIDNAMRNVPTPSRDQAGKLIFMPHEVVARRLALAAAAGRPTPLAGPVFSTVNSTPASSLSSHDNILPHSADLPLADTSSSGLAGPSLLDTDPPDITLSPPADASGSGLAGSYPFDADVPGIVLSDPGAPADATALATSHRFPGAPDLFAATAFAEFQTATCNDTLDPDMLAFGPPANGTLYSSPPAAIAPTAAMTGPAPPAVDARGPLRSGSDRDTTSVRPGPAMGRFPTAAGALPIINPYKYKRWILLQIQRELALALRRIIADSTLADKLYDAADGRGPTMLVLIQDFVGAHMTAMQATLTANFARSQVIHALIDPASSNCAHAFLEAVSKYLEVSRLCPVLCSDADLAITLGRFLDQLPEKFGSGLRFQILMYKSNRESAGNAADSDDDSASSTPRRLLLQSDLARALKEHDRSVRRKAEELRISTSITDFASTPAQATQLADLQQQLKVLQERLAMRHAPATSSSKRPSAAPAPANPVAPVPSPRSTARALAVASTTAPKRAIARAKDIGPRMRNCAHCDVTDGTWTETARPTLAPPRHQPQVGLPHPHLPRHLATSDPPPHPPPRSPPPPSLRPIPWHLPRPALRPTPNHQRSLPATSLFAVFFWPLPLRAPPRDRSANPRRDHFPTLRLLDPWGPPPGDSTIHRRSSRGASHWLPSSPRHHWPPLTHNTTSFHVDIPPLPPSTDSKRLQTRRFARLHAAVSGTTLTSIWPIRCSTSLAPLATAFM